jgi:hypothetical protein
MGHLKLRKVEECVLVSSKCFRKIVRHAEWVLEELVQELRLMPHDTRFDAVTATIGIVGRLQKSTLAESASGSKAA